MSLSHSNPIELTPKDMPLVISGPSGHIEAILRGPKEASIQGIAIICHPHPLFEGTMHNKVVSTLSRTYLTLGMVTLRFNFRGVGKSQGEFAQGIGETEDLLAVYEWAKAHLPGAPIYLAGFSFGSYVAYRGKKTINPVHLALIAPAVENCDYRSEVEPECPWLVALGSDDEVVSTPANLQWIEERPKKPEVLYFEGVGHFFHGELVTLRQRLLHTIQQQMDLSHGTP